MPCCLWFIFWCVSWNLWVFFAFFSNVIWLLQDCTYWVGIYWYEPTYIDVIIGRIRYSVISPVFSEALYSGLRGWARLFQHCLRSNAGNSSDLQKNSGADFIAYMMSSLIILMSDRIFTCVCPKKSFGYLTYVVGSGVLTTLLYWAFVVRSFLLFRVSRFSISSRRGLIPALMVEFFFTNL